MKGQAIIQRLVQHHLHHSASLAEINNKNSVNVEKPSIDHKVLPVRVKLFGVATENWAPEAFTSGKSHFLRKKSKIPVRLVATLKLLEHLGEGSQTLMRAGYLPQPPPPNRRHGQRTFK